jgi:hypothetical protein
MNRPRVLAVLFLWLMLLLAGALLVQFRLHHPPSDMMSFRTATPAEASLTKTVITKQLLCFRRADFNGAMELQTHIRRPGLDTPGQMRNMIRGLYPEFCTFASVEFGPCMADQLGDRTAIHVTLVASDGSETGSRYILARENGLYRVFAVIMDSGPYGGRRRPGQPLRNPRDLHLPSRSYPPPPGL